MDLVAVNPQGVGEENPVVDCDGVVGHLGGNVAEDSDGGCFLSAEAIDIVSPMIDCQFVESAIERNKSEVDILERPVCVGAK